MTEAGESRTLETVIRKPMKTQQTQLLERPVVNCAVRELGIKL
jgi:hypothetical protein